MKNQSFPCLRELRLRQIAAIVGFCAFLPATHAASTTSGSAIVSNLRYELVDLTPTDAIAPSLVWTATEGNVRLYHDGVVLDDWNDGSAPIVHTWTDGLDTIAASVQIPSGFESTALSASIFNDGRSFDTNSAVAQAYFDFELDAGTGIVFYADYAMQAARVGPENAVTYAYTDLFFELTSTGDELPYFDADHGSAWTNGEVEQYGTALVFYDNLSTTNWTGNLRVQASGQAQVGIQPVPEPSTYAMLAAGLGLLGMRWRRKDRARAG